MRNEMFCELIPHQLQTQGQHNPPQSAPHSHNQKGNNGLITLGGTKRGWLWREKMDKRMSNINRVWGKRKRGRRHGHGQVQSSRTANNIRRVFLHDFFQHSI